MTQDEVDEANIALDLQIKAIKKKSKSKSGR